MAVSRGDDWNGDESVFSAAFCNRGLVTVMESALKLLHSRASVMLTLGDVADWRQLGEFRLFSIGEISESGRGIALDFDGEEPGVLLFMRSGWTWDAIVRRDVHSRAVSTYRLRRHTERTTEDFLLGVYTAVRGIGTQRRPDS